MISLNEHHCLKCAYAIYESVYTFSSDKMGFALCKKCQSWYNKDQKFISKESKQLFLALKKRGVNVEMEKDDGHKHIDLVITSHRINIEVDGSHHYTQAKQSMSDLKRTCHSLLKGYVTLRIPNVLVKNSLEEAADQLVGMLKEFKKNHSFS